MDSFYLVEGVVENEIKGIRNICRNAIYQDLTYASTIDGDYYFDYPNGVRYNEWAAISGAPIFDNHCRLVGMVVRAVECTNQIRIIPANTIIRLIERQMEIDSLSQ